MLALFFDLIVGRVDWASLLLDLSANFGGDTGHLVGVVLGVEVGSMESCPSRFGSTGTPVSFPEKGALAYPTCFMKKLH